MRAPVLMATRGYARPDVGPTWRKAWDLARQLGAAPAALAASHGLWVWHGIRGELPEARRWAIELTPLAEAAGLPTLAAQADALNALWSGQNDEAIAAARRGLVAYDRTRHDAYQGLGGHDPAVGCYVAAALAHHLRDEPEAARTSATEGLALAEQLDQPASRVFALQGLAWVAVLDDDAAAALRLAEQARSEARSAGVTFWDAMAAVVEAWAEARLRPGLPALEGLVGALASSAAAGDGANGPLHAWLHADALIHAGQPTEARRVAAAALGWLPGQERWFVERIEAVILPPEDGSDTASLPPD